MAGSGRSVLRVSRGPATIDGMPFACVVCGVDGSGEALAAARQASRLLAPGGVLHLVAAVEIGSATLAGFEAVYAAEQLRAEAAQAVQQAEREVGREEALPRIVDGPAATVLVTIAEQENASLVAVGARRRRRRAAELLLGSTTLSLLRDAPCSVLVAREVGSAEFPRRILVGIDGSEESARAAAVAARIAERLDAVVAGVLALGGKNVDPAAAGAQPFEVALDGAHPVEALTRRAEDADLLVVGSRGLHGLRALGPSSRRPER